MTQEGTYELAEIVNGLSEHGTDAEVVRPGHSFQGCQVGRWVNTC